MKGQYLSGKYRDLLSLNNNNSFLICKRVIILTNMICSQNIKSTPTPIKSPLTNPNGIIFIHSWILSQSPLTYPSIKDPIYQRSNMFNYEGQRQYQSWIWRHDQIASQSPLITSTFNHRNNRIQDWSNPRNINMSMYTIQLNCNIHPGKSI